MVVIFSLKNILAELQRASRASKASWVRKIGNPSSREAPWVRKIGNPSSRENLVMTSVYKRANVCPSIRTDSGGWGGASRDIPHGHPYGKLRYCLHG